MSLHVGVELPNRPDAVTDEELARIAALRCEVVKVRGYHGLDVLERCLDRNPLMKFLVRPDADGPVDPPRWLGQVEQVLDWLGECGREWVFLLDSEPNHVNSPNRERPIADYATALEVWVNVLRALWPEIKLSSPPLAVMQDDLEWLRALEPVYRRLGLPYRGAHIYWQDDNHQSAEWGRRLKQYAAITGPARWVVAEVGDATVDAPAWKRASRIGDVLRWLNERGDVEMACIFIAGSDDPQWTRFILPADDLAAIRAGLAEQVSVSQPGSQPIPEVPTMDPYERVRDWADIFVRESRIHGVPPSVTAAIMVIESGGNPNAESPPNFYNGVALGTAKGLMQVLNAHFQEGEDPFDPQTNIRAGVRVLATGLARWGTWEQSVAAYFGAIDAQGNITEATDATGTSGIRYVALWSAARQRFLDLDTEEVAEVPVDKAAILASIDTLWGIANSLDAQADKLKAEAARIRAYVVAIKQSAGIE